MSIQSVGWALELTEPALRPREKLVLVAVCFAMNSDSPDAGSWLSNATIAERVGIAPRNVRTTLNRLVELGLLERVERVGKTSIYRLGEDVCIPPTPDACIPPPRMSASGVGRMSTSAPDLQGGMSASGGGGCLHPGGEDAYIPQSVIDPEDDPEPPLTPPPRSAVEARSVDHAASGGGGGVVSDFEDQDREDARRRLLAWWSSEIEPIDDRIMPIRVVTDAMLDRFLEAQASFPNVVDDLPEALAPLATWITHRLSFETFFRDANAIDRALGGLYRETDAKRVRELAEARRAREKRDREARALEDVRRRFAPPRATDEIADIDPALVAV